MVTKICATFFLSGIKEEEPCKQVINMGEESYDYMTSKECPNWASKGEWAKLSKTQRVIKHLARTKEYLGASKFTFEILPD